ncbi:FAD-dependent monooxygenase [Cellulomonas humilata]|uniref:2-polyprenyl-6-methoxyphenol hydroxylase-like FAD-dependent oxidoreductase n=1 Tax=Cellulomonas humilata TaxID=144055 RepID=A0ABU0EBY7_9CELL|nr:FAD-dependent monooxygenase [Cellulomonas humilata]MDQ0372781.1 2-polyprenyl-6-methoxyphenol hydroxylase-like FAD-dependent oxidoreductase [Cellulomonas humilata]
MPRALIIGGGVAGPAAAQLLTRDGWDAHVYEAHAEPDPYAGLFLNVATNGLAVLETLGLRKRLLTDGHRAGRMVMWSRTGKELGTVPNGPAREPERGSVIVRRSWLHQVLREGSDAAGVPTTYGARLVSIDQDEHGVRATFADGAVAEGDLLVGADGIGSPTRRHIDPDAPEPTYSGLVGVGGFARVPGLEPTPETQHFVFGARSFFGYLVRADGTTYWFANVTAPDRDATVTLDDLRALHSDDPYPVPQILAATSDELRPYPIDDLVGVRQWSRGRAVAVGDAVHATSPSAGQGASLALEDAAVLARALREQSSFSDAFASYQSARQPRTDAVVKYARAINAQKRVTKSRVGVAIRDAMMPMFLRRAADDTRNDWLYNHTVG